MEGGRWISMIAHSQIIIDFSDFLIATPRQGNAAQKSLLFKAILRVSKRPSAFAGFDVDHKLTLRWKK
jgi:hypothetical protein